MSNTAGWRGTQAKGAAPPRKGGQGLATAIAEREAGDSLLRFLSRLSAFGLTAESDPLLKPDKPAG